MKSEEFREWLEREAKANDALADHYTGHPAQLSVIVTRRKKARALRLALWALDAKDGLEFYAEERNYRRGRPGALQPEFESPLIIWMNDKGAKARTILAAFPEDE